MMNTTTITYNVFQDLENDLDFDANNLKLDAILNKLLQEQYPRFLSNQQSTPPYFDDENVPDYLAATNSDLYIALIPDLNETKNYAHMDELRSLAVLNHYMSLLTLQKNLWYACFQSGTGQLRPENWPSIVVNHRLCYWPEMVRKTMIKTESIPFNNDDGDDFKHQTYLEFVQNYRTKLNEHYERLKDKFNAIKNSFERYTDAITDTIEAFVRKQGLQAFQLHCDARLTLIKYDYTDRLLKYEYFQRHPDDQQIELARTVCQLTFNKEKILQEYSIYRYNDCYNRLPPPFNILKNFVPNVITDLKDVNFREELSHKYTRIIDRTIVEVLHLYSVALQSIRKEHEKKFNADIESLWKHQRQLPESDRLSSHMVKIIQARQKNILECLQEIYKIRVDFFLRCPS